MKYFCSLLCFLFVAPSVFAGNEGPHGGDMYALEFVAIGKAISRHMDPTTEPVLKKWNLDQELMDVTIDTTVVVSDETVLKGDAPVDAVNFPDVGQIRISRSRWRLSSLEERVRLSLHEYLGILKIELDHYDASIALDSVIQKTLADQAIVGSNSITPLFYGRSALATSLNVYERCESGAPTAENAKTTALQSAGIRCHAQGFSRCPVIDVSFESRFDPAFPGFQYCDVNLVLKGVR